MGQSVSRRIPVPARPPPRRRDVEELLVSYDNPYRLSALLRPAVIGALAAIAAVAAWAVLAELDEVAVAPGRIVAAGGTKRVQAVQTSIVTAINVEEGQFVEAGTVLVTLDSTAETADLQRIRSELMSREAEIFTLEAMISGRAQTGTYGSPPADIDPAIAGRHLQAMLSETAAQLAEANAIERRIDEQLARIDSLTAAIEKFTRLLPLARQRLEAREQLALTGSGPRLSVLDAEKEYIEIDQQLSEQRAKRAEETSVLSRLREERTLAAAKWRQSLLERLVEAQRRRYQLEKEFAQLRHALSSQSLVAPVSGYVHDLRLHAPGEVAVAGQDLMYIVPSGEVLEAEALLSNKDIGFISPGQSADIKFRTFPYTIYGVVEGTVREVAADAVGRDDGELVFPVRVTLGRHAIRAEGRDIPVSAGMEVEVDIKIGRRQVYQYVLAPLLRFRDASLRER